MRTSPRLVASLGVALLSMTALSGCVGSKVEPMALAPDPLRINADYKAGAVHDTAAEPIPSLNDIINNVPSPASEASPEDLLRSPAMREGALAYGAKGGLAWETRANNLALNSRADEFGRVYDFNRVLIEAPGHAKIAPPVISKADAAWETSDAGRTLRVADTVYQIVEQARFVPNAPVWQSYLMRAYSAPQVPANVLLPRNSRERTQWNDWVKEGWEMGREQAHEILKMDLARLDRDFNGMLRYKSLLEEGKVSPPTVADSQLGTTGSGEDMRVNDRAVTITQDPRLNVTRPSEWRAAPTAAGPGGFPTGEPPAASHAAPAAPVPVAAAPVAVQVAAPAVAPSSVPSAPSDGGSRRAW